MNPKSSSSSTTMHPSPIGTTATSRPRRSRRERAILGLAICTLSYTIIWDGVIPLLPLQSPRGGLLRRRYLAYLDPSPVNTLKYGRHDINQNYQSLLQPSGIDSSLFRKQAEKKADKGYDESNACNNIFLFMPHQFAHNGHGSQLNNYLLASMIATFTNRAMVILDPPAKNNVFKSNSQFGCPPEAWETKMVRKGGTPKKIGWNKDFPNGLTRLIKHPAWLSRQCEVPCQGTFDYDAWEEIRVSNNVTTVPVPQEVTCGSNGQVTNVLAMGGPQVRDYFDAYYKERMLERSQPPSVPGAQWALRLGAAPHEARIFGSLTERHEIWDYISAIMARSGIMRFQPWIARDVEVYIKEHVQDLPLDVQYDAIHVRRGDKLESDAKRFVIKYWDGLKMYDEETGEMPKNYIPFVHYLREFENVECHPNEDGDVPPRLVYVATDDPREVQSEIAELPKDSEGYNLLPPKEDDKSDSGSCQHRFKFVFNNFDPDPEIGYHLDGGKTKGDCEDRYARNIASIADLMILTKSDIFIGEFNSNWGRLVRTFRLKMNNSAKIMNGARPVISREMKVAWGNQRPGPPGW